MRKRRKFDFSEVLFFRYPHLTLLVIFVVCVALFSYSCNRFQDNYQQCRDSGRTESDCIIIALE